MTSQRIASLDFIRGAAVMGILVANLPGFALPRAAYFSPLAWGGTDTADLIAWAVTFMLVEGKMRGLFALLFGASLLLVVDRAGAAGENAAAVHLRRMAALFAIGCAHLYLLWWGDILNQYALIGVAAFLFAAAPVRLLLAVGAAAIALAVLDGATLTLAAYSSAPQATPGQVATWNAIAAGWGVPPRAAVLREIVALRGPWGESVAWRWQFLASPFVTAARDGAETLGYMLLGMAGYRSGFLIGAWPRRRYAQIAAAAILPGLAVHAALAWSSWQSGFDMRRILLASMTISPAIRPAMVAGYAALLILLFRRDGTISRNVAAAGRMALSNYLATSLLMTFVFDGWGLGQFGAWGRAQAYWIVIPAWTAMLVGSRWWLARFAYGPAEWVWRALARGEMPHSRAR